METRKCIVCKREFIPINGTHKICSKNCKSIKLKEHMKNHYKKNKLRILEKVKSYANNHKEKIKKYNKEYYQINKEKLSKINKEYYIKNIERIRKRRVNQPDKSKEWRKKNPDYKKEYRKNKKEQYEAQTKAFNNIKISKDKKCEICKINLATQRHHPDYSKPLEVKFLCSCCHHKIHRKVI